MRVVGPLAVNDFGRKAVLHGHESMLSGKDESVGYFQREGKVLLERLARYV